jgi:hypothetical protein
MNKKKEKHRTEVTEVTEVGGILCYATFAPRRVERSLEMLPEGEYRAPKATARRCYCSIGFQPVSGWQRMPMVAEGSATAQ